MSDDITKAIERAKELCANSTKGPWGSGFGDEARLVWSNSLSGQRVANCVMEIDAKFIAESRALLPRLILEVEQVIERGKVPEWRPLSVLTYENRVAENHDGLWLIKTGHIYLIELGITSGIIHNADTGEDIANYGPHAVCRPVDNEGIPVPWAKVGL
jgi:hypothetical protein